MPPSDGMIRKPLRARGYDYTFAGMYFVTICIQDMEHRLGLVNLTGLVLNDAGHLVDDQWAGIPDRHPDVGLDAYVVMPNHLHGIVAPGTTPDIVPPSLSVVVGQFKSLTTVAYGRGVCAGMLPTYKGSLWQRCFHDHIIRNERSLDELRAYIDGNPARWLTQWAASTPRHPEESKDPRAMGRIR